MAWLCTIICELLLDNTQKNMQMYGDKEGKNFSIRYIVLGGKLLNVKYVIEMDHTDDKIGFFLCEIKLFQIGDSEIDLSFTVVERPNDWMKEIKKTTAANPTQQQRFEYWQEFNDYAFQNAEFVKAFNKRKLTTRSLDAFQYWFISLSYWCVADTKKKYHWC